MLDKIVFSAKNLVTRDVFLTEYPPGYLLSITEYGVERTGFLMYKDVEMLQKLLWNSKAVSHGIAINVPRVPGDYLQRLEIPSWAMERLRTRMLNKQIQLNVL